MSYLFKVKQKSKTIIFIQIKKVNPLYAFKIKQKSETIVSIQSKTKK